MKLVFFILVFAQYTQSYGLTCDELESLEILNGVQEQELELCNEETSSPIANSEDEVTVEDFRCYLYVSELRYYRGLFSPWPTWSRWALIPGSTRLEHLGNGNYTLSSDIDDSFYGINSIDVEIDKNSMLVNSHGAHQIVNKQASVIIRPAFNHTDEVLRYTANFRVEFKPKFPKVDVRDRGIEYQVTCNSRSWYR